MCPPSAVVFLLFTVPKFYEVKKEDCDKVINAAKAKFDEIYKKLDAEAKGLEHSTTPADVARRVALLLRLNRQKEAVSTLKAAPADAPELAPFRTALKIQGP